MFTRVFVAFAIAAITGGCGENPTDAANSGEGGGLRLTVPGDGTVIVGDSSHVVAFSVENGRVLSFDEVVWSSDDLSVATIGPAGGVYARAPGAVRLTARAAGLSGSTTMTVAPRTGGYTAEELSYFLDISIGTEFGGGRLQLAKWTGEVRIGVSNDPGPANLETLMQVISELDVLTESAVFTFCTCESPEIAVVFAPSSTFPRLNPWYVPGNLGFVSTETGPDFEITRAQVLISTTGLSQTERDHLIREELTQATGLLNDSPTRPTSIFFGPWSTTTEYALIDRAVIEMLYRASVTSGMNGEEAAWMLRRETRR